MELNPSSGRPEKDPEDRRSELVHVRMCPSHKKIVRQEADRRDASMTLVVVRIAFEEMNPSGRIIPDPSAWRWLLDKADDYRRTANDPAVNYPGHELSGHDMHKKRKEVKERSEKRVALWRKARDEKREKTIGVRLKPGRLRWLEDRTEEKGTSRSGLLRVRTLEGINRRDQMDEMAELLYKCKKKIEHLRDDRREEKLSEDEMRDAMLAVATEIEETLEAFREQI